MMYDNEGKEQLLLNDYSDGPTLIFHYLWLINIINLLFIYFVTAEVIYR